MQAIMEVLNTLGLTPIIQTMAVAMGAIFLYRYFTDKG